MQKDLIAKIEQSLKNLGKGPIRGTKEELEAMSPRRAAFHRFMAGVFPDPEKAIEAVWQFARNTHDKRPPKA